VDRSARKFAWRDTLMSYAVPVQPGRSRPTVVSIAVLLLWAVVALRVVTIALGFVPTPELDRAMEELNGDDTLAASGAIGQVLSVVVGFIVAAAFAVLAVFVGKGSQPARVTTWVLGGIVALCMGCGLIASVAAPSLLNSVTSTGDTQTDQAVQDAQELLDLTPAWLTITLNVVGVLSVLALLGAIIVLAVPSANEYFRKEEQVWVPPTGPGGGYPQYPLAMPQYPPATPQYPPATPQQPGFPPVPPPPGQPPAPGQPPFPPSQPPFPPPQS
jgi:MFS family permease